MSEDKLAQSFKSTPHKKTCIRTHSDVEPDTPSPPIMRQPRPESPYTGTPSTEGLSELRKNMELTEEMIKRTNEEAINRLNNELVTRIQDVVKTELDQFCAKYLETLEKLELDLQTQVTLVKSVTQENRKLEDELTKEKRLREELEEKMIKIETFSRKDNLKFFGMPEEKAENCEDKIVQCLNSVGLGKLHPRAIARAHRVGKFIKGNKPRPIIVKFDHYKDKVTTLQNASRFKQHGIHIEEDFPEEIIKRRKVLSPVYWAIYHYKDNSHPNTWPYRRNVKLYQDKLYFNGAVITVDTLEKLPPIFQPQHISTPSKKNITAFFTHSSPLSNHHECELKIDQINYNCVEQYYMAQKASFSGDLHIVEMIMRESDPVRQKSLGKPAEKSAGFKRDNWNSDSLKVMKTALSAKFSQVDACKQFLLRTGNNILVEANPSDRFWGAGLHLRHNDLWEPQKWKGKNELGKLLMEIRHELQ